MLTPEMGGVEFGYGVTKETPVENLGATDGRTKD